ncbi:MAG: hypothetical protein F6K65_21350 [Moorea sp. SIO3C2]|nr:hypothetical protein [Moorena sp. SIO3C2]
MRPYSLRCAFRRRIKFATGRTAPYSLLPTPYSLPHKGRFFTFGSSPTPNPRPVGGGTQGEEKENNE